MRLSRPFSLLTMGLIAFTLRVHADDLCKIRPDLCKGPVKTKKKKTNRNYHNETAREADELEREIILEEQERRTKRAEQNYNSFPSETSPRESEDDAPAKPLGFSQVQRADRSHQAMRDFGRRKPRQIDKRTQNTFDAYLNSNASNPALNSRMPSSQNAFQPSKWGTNPGTVMKADPATSGGGFNQGQGPFSQNGGFSSKPVTLEQPQAAPVSGETSQSSSGESPVQNVEAPHDGDGGSPAGPSN